MFERFSVGLKPILHLLFGLLILLVNLLDLGLVLRSVWDNEVFNRKISPGKL